MSIKHGFLNSLFLTGALAVSALSFGLFVPQAQAEEPMEDFYNTGTAHITINSGNDEAAPLLYPNRFVALQVFQGSVPSDAGTEDTLSGISWGASVDSDKLIRQLAISNWDIGELNIEAPDVTSGKINPNDYEGITTLGKLFTRYCIDRVRDATSAYASAGGTNESGLDSAAAELDSSNVSAVLVANFLQQFAMTSSSAEGDITMYQSSSIFTSSEVSAGFAYVVSQSSPDLDTLTEGESKWTSYGLKYPTTGKDTSLATSLFNQPIKEFPPDTTGWVIDSVENFGEGPIANGFAKSKGLPIGYYIVIDKVNEVFPLDDYNPDDYDEWGEYIDEEKQPAPDEIYGSHDTISVSELILRVVDNNGLVLNIKSDIPTVDKKIKGVSTDDFHDASTVHTSDPVTYILTATLPDNVMSYKDLKNPGQNKYSIVFNDILPRCFNIDYSSLHVFVNVDGDENGCTDPNAKDNPNLNAYRDTLGKEGNSAIEVNLDTSSGGIDIEDGYPYEISISNIFDLKNLSTGETIKINSKSIIYAVYSGTISTATYYGYGERNLLELVAGSLEPEELLRNTVWLSYSNNPYVDGYGETLEDAVQHYLFGLDLVKFEDDFGGDNARLQDAGFSVLQASPDGDTGAMTPDLNTSDPDDFTGKDKSVKVAWFRKYEHSYMHMPGDDGYRTAPKGYDTDDIYDPDQEIYIFAGWHEPVLATQDYVDAFNSSYSSPSTDHMHAGMLVTALDDDYKPVYRGSGGSNRAETYYQVLMSDEDGKVTVLGLGNDAYTVIESLTPTNHKTLQPFTWRITSPNVSQSAGDLKIYAQTSSGKFEEVASSEANATPAGDAKMFTYARNDLPSSSPYLDHMAINLYLRNISGVVLPMTGGVGTIIFYIAGIALALGSAAYIIYRRRESNVSEI